MIRDWYSVVEELAVLKSLAERGILDFDAATRAVEKLMKDYLGLYDGIMEEE